MMMMMMMMIMMMMMMMMVMMMMTVEEDDDDDDGKMHPHQCISPAVIRLGIETPPQPQHRPHLYIVGMV